MEAYVYGIASAGGVEEPPSAGGVDGRPVETVTSGSLAALVSEVAEVPVKASRRNLMAHSAVLQEVIATRCVLPMRFGVVMPSREAVAEELLEAHRDDLTSQLAEFEPYVELDVRALCPEDELLASILRTRPDIKALRQRPGYADKLTLGELVAQAVEERREEVTQRLVAELEPLAAATALDDPLHQEMLTNAAFLVERGAVPDFDAAVERAGAALGDTVRLRYAGPLPPHKFVTEAAAWG